VPVKPLISVVLPHPGFFDPLPAGMPLHGANLATAAMLRALACDPETAGLEVFLPPGEMLPPARLAEIAAGVLPPDLRGQGRLRFHALHTLPDAWADGAERVLYTVDPEHVARDRYLRDRFARGPTVLCCDTHGLALREHLAPLAALAAAPAAPFDSIVCISRAVQEGMRRLLGHVGGATPPCRLDLIPRFVDADFFAPTSPSLRAGARRLLDLPRSDRIALYLGRVTPSNKADLLPLLHAFAAASRPGETLLIAGAEGAAGYRRRLRAEGDALGLGSRLLVHGEVLGPARPLYYAAADLFAFPGDTIQEAFAGTVAEAMASGLPVIASDWDGMRDSVVHDETGLLVPTWWVPGTAAAEAFSPAGWIMTDYLLLAQCVWVDADALAEALRQLLGDAARRQRLGAAGRARVEAHFARPAVMARWRALWQELLDLAATETATDAAARRAHAARLGSPTPYLALCDHYATGVLDDGQRLRLSPRGRRIEAGDATLAFYDETLPLVRAEVIDALFALLRGAGAAGLARGEAQRAVPAETRRPFEETAFHVALLLKHRAVEWVR
jgi:glycosyltransferase involved in cell wall biosynthesis